tara:strand:+ start:5724 stop:6203 length:480 start_codon:yes stop_codon:yes gene_type:complete
MNFADKSIYRFWGDFIIADNKYFFNTAVLKIILEQMGWTLNEESNLIDDLDDKWQNSGFKWKSQVLPIRPDFYPNGAILASSKKYNIVCDGYSEIEYKDKIFKHPSEILTTFGEEGIADIENWNIKIEKEWVITNNTRSSNWTYSFSLLSDCPFRNSLR